MRKSTLVWRSLVHFRGASLALVAGLGVGTAVLTGALLVGDSVRGSLEDLVAERLGPVEAVVTTQGYFTESLAAAVGARVDGRLVAVPAIVVRGSASVAGAGATAGRRAARVDVFGLPPDNALIPLLDPRRPNPEPRTPVFPFCVLNDVLAAELGVQVGDVVNLRVPTSPAIPREAALGRRDRASNAPPFRVAGIARDRGPLRSFSLSGTQAVPRNAWVALAELQKAVERPDQANTLLVAGDPPSRVSAQVLSEGLRAAATLADYELRFRTVERSPSGAGGVGCLESERVFLTEAAVAAAEEASRRLKIPLQKVFVYLANTIARAGDTADTPAGAAQTIPYAVVAGIEPVPGGPIPSRGIVLNQWAADDLAARPGDRLCLLYAERLPTGQVIERGDTGDATVFRVERIIPDRDLGADPSLTPAFKGITDAPTMAAWDAPPDFGFQFKRIRPRDEAYWQAHRAAPKAFINLATAQDLWGTPSARLTSIRVPIDQAEAFRRSLLEVLSPEAMGLEVRPVREAQGRAARGTTDFGPLFLGFSSFLIIAAALLAGLLLRLAVDRRARQVGLLLAAGFRPPVVRRLFLAEGMALALVGGVLGLLGAVAYAWVVLAGLRVWWARALGMTFVRLHIEPMSLGVGLAGGLMVAYGGVWWGVRQVGRRRAARLLSGSRATEEAGGAAGRRIASVSAIAATALAALGLALAVADVLPSAEGFFAVGVMLLVASLAGHSVYLRRGARRLAVRGRWSVERLGLRNAGRQPARSGLTAGVIAAATFVVVVVAAMRQGPPADPLDPNSGTGGFNLLGEVDIPLGYDPSTASGRERLGLGAAPDLWERVEIVGLRASDGEDISCLNLLRPSRPRILGVPPGAFAGRFSFSAAENAPVDPWALLDRPNEDGAVNVVADAETAEWILHQGLGDTMTVPDGAGRPQTLRIAALLKPSIFQGALLMGEADFRRLFPRETGFKTVLLRAEERRDETAARQTLDERLADYGVVVDRTADRLALFAQVVGTYLSTFQALGGLGLVLGTVGLAVVLIRGLIERRGELALLTALGWDRRALMRMVVAENAYLLATGLAAGTVSALVAAAPGVAARGSGVNWLSLGATLAAILAVGLGSLAVGVRRGLKSIGVADLRSE